jgi:hypothetical protein
MLFCQLAQAKSLREITQGLQCCEGRLQHLGVQSAPKRSGKGGKGVGEHIRTFYPAIPFTH